MGKEADAVAAARRVWAMKVLTGTTRKPVPRDAAAVVHADPAAVAAAALKKLDRYAKGRVGNRWDVDRTAREVHSLAEPTPAVLAAGIAVLAQVDTSVAGNELQVHIEGLMWRWYNAITDGLRNSPHADACGEADAAAGAQNGADALASAGAGASANADAGVGETSPAAAIAADVEAATAAARRAAHILMRYGAAVGRVDFVHDAYLALVRTTPRHTRGHATQGQYIASLCNVGAHEAAAAYYRTLVLDAKAVIQRQKGTAYGTGEIVRVGGRTAAAAVQALPYVEATEVASWIPQPQCVQHDVSLRLMKAAMRTCTPAEAYTECQRIVDAMFSRGEVVRGAHWDCLLDACVRGAPQWTTQVLSRRAAAGVPRTGRTFAILMAAAATRQEAEALYLTALEEQHVMDHNNHTSRVGMGPVHLALMTAYARFQCAEHAEAFRIQLSKRAAAAPATAGEHRRATYHAHRTRLDVEEDCRLF